MDRYTKAFVAMSLAWFAVAAGLGAWLATTGAPEWAQFGHVHFNLLGFMAMMIYGVGYFILPRFNARPLAWPGWVPVHFWVSNIGLVGLVATFAERPSAGFNLFAGLSAAGAVMFALNLATSVLGRAPAEEAGDAPAIAPSPAAGTAAAARPAGDARAGRDRGPGAGHHRRDPRRRDPHPLAAARGRARGGRPLPPGGPRAPREGEERARHTRDGLHEPRSGSRRNRPAAQCGGRRRRPPAARRIGPNDVIGEVLKTHPATETVFRKYYGAACFSCPGQATESVRQSAMMHNAKEAELLRELNEAAGLGG